MKKLECYKCGKNLRDNIEAIGLRLESKVPEKSIFNPNPAKNIKFWQKQFGKYYGKTINLCWECNWDNWIRVNWFTKLKKWIRKRFGEE